MYLYILFPQLIDLSQIIHQSTTCSLVLTTKNISPEETEEGADVILHPICSSPQYNQHWFLDYKPDGTFLIVSNTNNRLLVTCENVVGAITNIKLIMSRFTGEDNQLWRFDGSYIESVKFEGHVFSFTPNTNNHCNLVLHVKEIDNGMQHFKHMVSF